MNDSREPLPEAREICFPGSRHRWLLYHFSTLDSTNDFLHRRTDSLPDRSVVTTDVQTAGRGRMGRSWISPPGGLYFSFLLSPGPSPDFAPRLGLLVADLVCDLLEESGIPGQVKWPNDVVVGGRKMAGILPECGNHPQPWMIVGLGMNLAGIPGHTDSRGLVPSHWGAFSDAPEPMAILRDILGRLDASWPDRNLDPLQGRLASIGSRLWCRGQLVRMIRGPETFTGTVSGVAPDGCLILATSAGMKTFDSGELRPV